MMKKGSVFKALLAGVLLSGCAGSAASGASASSSISAASASAESPIVIAMTADLSTMDYEIATDGASFSMQSMCVSGLTQYAADGSIQPDLAESWDLSADGLTYTFHLRDGIKWSNGTPVTAADFVYGWQRLDDPATASEYAFLLDTIHVVNAADVFSGTMPVSSLGVEAPNEKTFTVHLSQPCGFFLGLMAFPSLFPLNQAFYEAEGDQYALSPKDLLYCGVYTMTDWTAGNEYTFTKNPDYWDASSYHQDSVVFKYIQDTQSAMLEYQQGQIDYVPLSGEMVDLYKDKPGFTSNLQGFLWYLAPNMSDPNLSNLNLRKAISLAIDRDSIADDVLRDGSIAADGFIPRSFAFDADGKDFRDTAGKLTSYDPTAAAAAYAKAKEELGGDVTVDLLYEDSEASKAVAENIQQMLEQNCPGLTITLDSKPKKTRLELMNSHEYQLGLTRWGPDYADPQTYLDLLLNDTDGNTMNYASDEYDALETKATRGEDAADAAKRWQDLIQCEQIAVSQDAAVIPVYQNGGADMVSTSVTGILFMTTGSGLYRHVKRVKS